MVNFFPLFLVPEGGAIEQAYIDHSMALRSKNLTPEQFRAAMDTWQKQQPPMPQCYVGHLVDHIDPQKSVVLLLPVWCVGVMLSIAPHPDSR